MSAQVRPKSTREYSQSVATTMAALNQARFLVVHFGRYIALKRYCRGVANGVNSN
jgi:hypothetical protein